MLQALFLDRDGTLNVDHGYIARPEDVELLPQAKEALALALQQGCRLFLITNQSGVGRGHFTMEDVHACNARLIELLDCGPNPFAGICIAPEHPDKTPNYRKPSPKYLLEMKEKHALDPAACWMIGDRRSDWQTGLNAGINVAAVSTGKPIENEEHAFLQEHKIPLYAHLMAFMRTLLS